ncbi:MAG: serine/threonine protein kinase, partial [Anaerolineae bacterium]
MSDTNLFIDRKIGQYTITSFIANGGMADVYQAIDKGLDRAVALKLLFPQYSRNKEFTERFQREARSAAKLRHPNIVQVYATGETDQGDQYIAMEFVDGGTLENKLSELAKDGKLIESSLVLLLMLQIADALRVAHEGGIVHRDLKPSNILLRKDINSPVLTDLGIAISTSEARLTQTNKMMGTPDYMSPEQAVGGEMDGRSDIYSFGVMLYELLCGRRPFAGDSPWVIVHKQINEDPTPLEKIRPGLTPLVYEVIDRCMQKNPDDRYQSTSELVQALTLAAQVEGVNAKSTVSLSTISLTAAGVNPPSSALTIAPGSAAHPLMKSTATGAHANQPGPRWGLVGILGGLIAVIIGVIAFLVLAVPPNVIRITAEPPQSIASVITETTPSAGAINQSATIMPTSTRAPATATAVVLIVTATTQPTATPTSTATPTETPTPTPNSQGSNSAILATGNGLPIRFEGSTRWGIGEEKNGTFQNTTERSHSGGSAGRLDYTFTTAENDYVVFLQVNPISNTPNTLSAWVYGDGSGHFVNAWVLDAKQQVWQVPLGQVFHTGWQEMTGAIQVDQDWPWSHISGPDNNKVDYPIQFYAIVVDDFNAAYVGDGTIFIDDIHADTQDIASLPTVQPVEPTPTPEGGATSSTATPEAEVEATAEAAATEDSTESQGSTIGRIMYM